MLDIIEHASSYQSLKAGEILLKYGEAGRSTKPIVIWIHGPTGTGKSAMAHKLAPDAWWTAKTLKWWDGYDAHANVVIDDFRADYCTFHELLRILDRYPYRVETKGGSRQLLANLIVVTSPFPPEHVYREREDIGQLLRRIDRTIFLEEKIEPIVDPDEEGERTRRLSEIDALLNGKAVSEVEGNIVPDAASAFQAAHSGTDPRLLTGHRPDNLAGPPPDEELFLSDDDFEELVYGRGELQPDAHLLDSQEMHWRREPLAKLPPQAPGKEQNLLAFPDASGIAAARQRPRPRGKTAAHTLNTQPPIRGSNPAVS